MGGTSIDSHEMARRGLPGMTGQRPREIGRRRLLEKAGLLGWGLAALGAGFPRSTPARAASEPPTPLRVGVVVPTMTGSMPLGVLSWEIAGESARLGAILAAEDADARGAPVEVLIASAPDAQAVLRAAERLLAINGVAALIGGLGEGQALALGRVAEAHGVVFLNIGSPDDALRQEARSAHTFHVEASASMYLDALAIGFAGTAAHRWFVVHEESASGEALYRRAREVLLERCPGMAEVGRVGVEPGKLEFAAEYEAIRRAGPDIVLLLLEPLAQLSFLGQVDPAGPEVRVTGFPGPVVQTRAFLSAVRQANPRVSWYHAALWEPTLNAGGAAGLSERFGARWGEPMDAPAWAAHAAVTILLEAVSATGTADAATLIRHLEDPRTTHELHKGVPLSFRASDHQLRQPLYLVQLDPEAQPGFQLSRRLGLARPVRQIPEIPPGADPGRALDGLGSPQGGGVPSGAAGCHWEGVGTVPLGRWVRTLRIATAAVTMAVALLADAALPGDAAAPGELGTVRVGLQAGGTLSWVTYVIERMGLDESRGIRVQATSYATKQATEIALRAGEVDVVVDDFIGVVAMRSHGIPVRAIHPFSLATGGVVVRSDCPIRDVAGLQGQRIAVASLDDKSWLILRALSVARHGVDLQRAAQVQAAAPPLMTQLLMRGDLDAAIPYWHIVARLVEAGQFRELVSVSAMLGELGLPADLPILVIVARDRFVEEDPDRARAFLEAVRDAWSRLASDPSLWDGILDEGLYQLDDRSLLASVRDRFVAGIPRGWDDETVRGLVELAESLVEVAGAEVVGVEAVDPGAFTTALAAR